MQVHEAPEGKQPDGQAEPPSTTPDPEVAETLRQGRRRPGRWLLVALGAIALIALLTWVFWPTSGEQARWELGQVAQHDLVVQVTAVGPLAALDTVEVGSDLSGRIERVLVEVNDHVIVGQELARIEPARYENAVAQAEASVAQARASLRQAQVQLEATQLDLGRAQRLAKSNAITQAELDTARITHEAQQASVAAARASLAYQQAALARAKEDLADSVIVSPIDGVVTQRHVDPGQTVVSSLQATPLFEVASDLAQMEAEVAVDEADIGRVSAGQPATFTVTAWPDRTFNAVVHSVDIAPDPNETVVVYDAELRLDNADLALRPGMTATAEIEVGRLEGVLLVPSAALRYSPKIMLQGGRMVGEVSGDQPKVWTLKNDTPVAVPVEVLGSDGRLTAVRGELTVGQSVVLSELGR